MNKRLPFYDSETYVNLENPFNQVSHGSDKKRRGIGTDFSILAYMTTATVEIKNNIALDLLQYLESIGMLRMLNTKPVVAGQKLSEKFSGSLSKESVSEMQKELNGMRNEWERDTF